MKTDHMLSAPKKSPYIVSTEEMESSRAWLEGEYQQEFYSGTSQRSEVREGRFFNSLAPEQDSLEMVDPEVMRRLTAAKALDLHNKSKH